MCMWGGLGGGGVQILIESVVTKKEVPVPVPVPVRHRTPSLISVLATSEVFALASAKLRGRRISGVKQTHFLCNKTGKYSFDTLIEFFNSSYNSCTQLTMEFIPLRILNYKILFFVNVHIYYIFNKSLHVTHFISLCTHRAHF